MTKKHSHLVVESDEVALLFNDITQDTFHTRGNNGDFDVHAVTYRVILIDASQENEVGRHNANATSFFCRKGLRCTTRL